MWCSREAGALLACGGRRPLGKWLERLAGWESLIPPHLCNTSMPSLLPLRYLFPPLDTSSLHDQTSNWPRLLLEIRESFIQFLTPNWAGNEQFFIQVQNVLIFFLQVSKMFLDHVPQLETALHVTIPCHCWRAHNFWHSYLGKKWPFRVQTKNFYVIAQSPTHASATSSFSSFFGQ